MLAGAIISFRDFVFWLLSVRNSVACLLLLLWGAAMQSTLLSMHIHAGSQGRTNAFSQEVLGAIEKEHRCCK